MKDHVALHLWMTTILISRGKMSSLFALLDVEWKCHLVEFYNKVIGLALRRSFNCRLIIMAADMCRMPCFAVVLCLLDL